MKINSLNIELVECREISITIEVTNVETGASDYFSAIPDELDKTIDKIMEDYFGTDLSDVTIEKNNTYLRMFNDEVDISIVFSKILDIKY